MVCVYPGHGAEPGLPQFGRAGVRVGQAVLKVNEHLRVSFMFLHLSRCHENSLDALEKVLYFCGKLGLLGKKRDHGVYF